MLLSVYRLSRLIRGVAGISSKRLKDRSSKTSFLYILLGLRTIKRGSPWMVWMNSFPAQNLNAPTSHPMF
jgi:hypothetical protein